MERTAPHTIATSSLSLQKEPLTSTTSHVQLDTNSQATWPSLYWCSTCQNGTVSEDKKNFSLKKSKQKRTDCLAHSERRVCIQDKKRYFKNDNNNVEVQIQILKRHKNLLLAVTNLSVTVDSFGFCRSRQGSPVFNWPPSCSF